MFDVFQSGSQVKCKCKCLISVSEWINTPQSHHVCCLHIHSSVLNPCTLCLSLTLSLPSPNNRADDCYSGALGGILNSLCSLCFGLMKTNEYIKPPQRRRRDWNTDRDETTHLTMQKPRPKPSLRPVLHKTCYLTCEWNT